MNRRSILSSLSSMVVAALAWPRRAEAGVNLIKEKKYTYTTNFYNGFYVQNSLVPGQVPVNVRVYEQNAVTLLGGDKKAFSLTVNSNQQNALVYATTTSTRAVPFHQTADGQYPDQKDIYVLVSADPQTGEPRITQAPNGVTW